MNTGAIGMDKLKNVLRGNEDQSNVDEERGKCVATESKYYVRKPGSLKEHQG